jgi:hypothetical protein
MPRTSLRRVGAAVAVPVAVLVLAGCGGGSNAAAAAAPTASPTGGPGGFRNGQEFQKIRECLTAAGISVPTPSFTRTGPRPTYTGPRPTRTGDRNFRGGGFSMFNDPKVKAALAACGIALPTGRPSGAVGQGRSPAPTS